VPVGTFDIGFRRNYSVFFRIIGLTLLASNDTLNRRGTNRPRPKELPSEDAIAAAKAAFKDRGTFLYGNPGKLEAQFMELGLLTVAERDSAVDDALSEIGPKDRVGPQPPSNISIPPYGGKVLYAFIWKSNTHGSVYLKFCLAGTTGLELIVLHSFHHERRETNE
jgi:hypothetical protein